jgi:O-glycosyl hydrolase
VLASIRRTPGRIRQRSALVAATALFAAGALVAASPARASATADAVVSAAPQQTIRGFGASGAWWTIDAQYFPAAVQQRIAELLFSDRGIALSQYRYNIGGGGAGVTVPTGGESELGAANRAPETFYTGPGSYDWSKDPGGTTFLRYAGQYHVPDIVGFVDSAPGAMTTNGQACGGSLTAGKEQQLADYVTAVVRHAHDAWHTTINYVSPMNEPDYTRSDCTQEGMAIPAAQRATVVRDVAGTLVARAPYSQVIADESSRVDTQFLPEVPQWMSVPGAAASVAALAHHTYDFPSDATLQQAKALGQSYHKPLWATEICCVVWTGTGGYWGQGYDPTITGGLAMADIVYQDLAQANDSAFDWWVAMSAALGCDPSQTGCTSQPNPNGWNDGLIGYDPNYGKNKNYSLYPTKRLWALGNFSRFVRPGAVRHEVTGVPGSLHVLAFSSGHQWQVVVINNAAPGTGDTTLNLDLGGGRPLHASGTYRTSATEDLARVRDPRVTSGHVTATIPGQTVTTFLLEG